MPTSLSFSGRLMAVTPAVLARSAGIESKNASLHVPSLWTSVQTFICMEAARVLTLSSDSSLMIKGAPMGMRRRLLSHFSNFTRSAMALLSRR